MDYPKSVPSVGLVGGKFVDEDPTAGTPGSLIPAQWGNAVTEEVLHVITAGGLVPDEGNNTQLLDSLSSIIATQVPAAHLQGIATLERSVVRHQDRSTISNRSMVSEL